MKCKFCEKDCKNRKSLIQHEIRCKKNPDKLDLSYLDSNRPKARHKGTNQFIKAKELGLSVPKVLEETKQKQSNAQKGRKHTEEERRKISESMKIAVRKYSESYSASNVNGRVKHYEINGFRIDGKWELEVAEFLDRNNIEWIKPNKGFEYEWEGGIHLYYPDFYLPEYDRYIEVKGYQRERDLYKWKVVPNLIVIKAKEIKEIREGKYKLGSFSSDG